MNIIRMKLQLHQNLSKSTPKLKFPPSLLLDQLPYTIIFQYQEHERITLFGDTNTNNNDDTEDDPFPTINHIHDSKDSSSPTIIRFNGSFNRNKGQKSSSYIKGTRLISSRQCINKFCPAYGVYGHDVHTMGCDFTASVIKALDFIKKSS